jgi:two-component system chemotaxis sensor kinase CheA
MAQLNEALREFLDEGTELLDQAEQDLLAMEKGGAEPATVDSLFRCFHSIKGSAGLLGFPEVQHLTHAAENVLGRIRDGKLAVASEIISSLLQVVDAVRKMLASILNTGGSSDHHPEAMIERLEKLLLGAPPPLQSNKRKEASASTPASTSTTPEPEPAQDVGSSANTSSSIRVGVVQLERLMNLVGELVLTRNQLLQFTLSHEDPAFLVTSQRLNLITTELQEAVMKARLQPINNVWAKFPRMVHDLAQQTGKQVRVEMEGRETELDRTIMEAIKDPLTHVLRNAVDHGIESPERRRTAGKPEEGRIDLRAFHEGGQVIIEVSDDGAGIDVERVRQRSLEKGIVTAEQLARMSEREAMALIFAPGLSTAEQVTDISGRGVGMDVVRTNVEKIGGTVDLQSRPGQGTNLKIKIPLTLAIIPALIVTTGGDRYAIPQVSLLELVRLEGAQAQAQIESIQGVPVYRLRGNLLPLVSLSRELRVDAQTAADLTNIVVLQAGDRQFGLVVDQVNDTEEIVVKPLGKHLKGIRVFAGATILGDGRVALILDVFGLAQRANVVAESRDRAMNERVAQAQAQDQSRQSWLLLRAPNDGRMAIPLSLVSRLEEFPSSAVERTGTRDVVQYRGKILPLLDLSRLLADPRSAQEVEAAAERETLQVVVFSHQGSDIGLRVEQILDVVQEKVTLQQTESRPGVLGTAVIQGRVTELLNLQSALRALDRAAVSAQPKGNA